MDRFLLSSVSRMMTFSTLTTVPTTNQFHMKICLHLKLSATTCKVFSRISCVKFFLCDDLFVIIIRFIHNYLFALIITLLPTFFTFMYSVNDEVFTFLIEKRSYQEP